MLKKWIALLLTVTMLFSYVPAQAAGMNVQLVPGDPATVVPVGTTIAFEVKGTGTAAVISPVSMVWKFIILPSLSVKMILE